MKRDDNIIFFLFALAVVLAAGIGIMAGHSVTAANKDVEIMDLQAQLETANASLVDAAVEIVQCRQREERMVVWTGMASFYAEAHHGKATTSGAKFDMNALTAAHWTLPFGALVLVLDVRRHTWTLVKINDRGPDPELGREIDLSRAAARQLGMERDGVTPVLMLTVQGRPNVED